MNTHSYSTSNELFCWAATGLAVALFSLLFSNPVLGFWRQMAASTIVLATLGAPRLVASFQGLRTGRGRHLVQAATLGLASAALLYGIFAAGQVLLLKLHPDSGHSIRAVYTMDGSLTGWRVALLLLLVIGPCEEIFWRGYVQRCLSARHGWKGVAMTTCAYTIAHVASGNPVLILAAAVCGTFWGIQYYLSGNLLLNVVSHALWTTTVFSLAPFSG